MNRSKYFLLGLFMLLVASNVNFNGENWKTILISDVKGYYAYLPAAFIYKDLNFKFHEIIEAKYFTPHNLNEYRYQVNGFNVNRYYIGTAILQLPFFLIGHILSMFSAQPIDGFSKYYAILINLSSIFYFLAGLFFLDKILQKNDLSENNIFWILMTITFATNAFLYAVLDPGFSHIYSFFCINLFFYLMLQFNEIEKSSYLPLMAVVLALIVLIRPINILIVFAIPFFFKSGTTTLLFFKKLFSPFKVFLLSCFAFTAALSIQFIVYKIQCGNWIVYSYGEYGFNFFSPEINNFLFSYRKGFFVYTPIALISMFGLVLFFKKNKFRASSLLFFLMLIVYFLSSWTMWWYGGSFSARVMLEFSLFVFFPMTFLFRLPLLKKGMKGLIILAILICQIQTYQYRYYDIHWENMNKELYWENFLRIDKYIK